LKILVDAKFAVSDALSEHSNTNHPNTIDMNRISKALTLQGDINIILHIWKKKDGSI